MGRAAEGIYDGLTHIMDSNGLAIRTALQYLYKNGHKHIAFLGESLDWAWNREIRNDFLSVHENKQPIGH